MRHPQPAVALPSAYEFRGTVMGSASTKRGRPPPATSPSSEIGTPIQGVQRSRANAITALCNSSAPTPTTALRARSPRSYGLRGGQSSLRDRSRFDGTPCSTWTLSLSSYRRGSPTTFRNPPRRFRAGAGAPEIAIGEPVELKVAIDTAPAGARDGVTNPDHSPSTCRCHPRVVMSV